MQKNRSILFLFCIFLCVFLTGSPLFSEKNRKQAGFNFLLITIDTLRPDRLSCYSSAHLKTPIIDSLSEKGILFTKAFAHTSTTLPSGGAYLEAGNLDGAIYCLEKALELKPDYGLALYNLGLAYLDKGDKVSAYDYFNRYRENYYSLLSPSEKKKLEAMIQKCKKKP